MRLEISKRFSSYSFPLMSANFMRTLPTMVEYRLSLFLAIGQVLWHFEILTCESMGKPKMWILSRKWLIVERNGRNFGTRCTTVHICRILLMPDSLSLIWGHSVHFAKLSILQFLTLLHSQFSSDSSKLYTRYHNHTGCHFFGKLQKLWHFEIFLTQDHMQLEFSISPTIFIGVYPNFVTTLATIVNLNACFRILQWEFGD